MIFKPSKWAERGDLRIPLLAVGTCLVSYEIVEKCHGHLELEADFSLPSGPPNGLGPLDLIIPISIKSEQRHRKESSFPLKKKKCCELY